MSKDALATRYRFGRFELQPSERRLLSDDQPIAVGPRAFDLLVTLVERAGELVTKDELLARVWPRLVVEENNVQVQASALRRILGPKAIATVVGRGYRFTPSVEPIVAEHGHPRARPHDLPQPLTSFVGREKDLAEYANLLERTRLLTLTGVGGCGKTRLAIKLSEMVLPSFRDGVRFIDLAPVDGPDRMALTVATAFRLEQRADHPIEQTLERHVADQQLLLVLDNCEHLLGACAALVERLLAAAPGLRVLVTSREGLGSVGERVVPVRSLSLPLPNEQDELALHTSEAVRLFVDRARLVMPDFAPSPRNAGAIVEICRRLDGIPLAIELAAARMKVLKVEEIRARLDHRFRLLTGTDRALPRHQTLLTTIQWSHDHLTPREQGLFRRLSVFAGGWTLAAATAVAGEDADEFEVLDTLGLLVSKSLIAVDREAEEESRYTMLETVRHYAHDRLEDTGELQDARVRHAKFFVALVTEMYAVASEAGRFDGWIERMTPDHENVLAAHAACGFHDDLVGHGVQLVGGMARYWEEKGMFDLGHRLTVEALGRAGADAPSGARCDALNRLGQIDLLLGRYDESTQRSLEALSIARALDDKRRIVEVLQVLGCIDNARGALRDARGYLEESLRLAKGLRWMHLDRSRHMMGELLRREGDLAGAEQLYAENLAESRARGRRAGVHVGLVNLGMVAAQRESAPELRRYLSEALQITEVAIEHRVGIVCLEVCAALASLLAAWELAARFHGAAEALASRIDLHHEPVDSMVIDPFVERARVALGEASFAAALKGGRGLSPQQVRAEVSAWLASVN